MSGTEACSCSSQDDGWGLAGHVDSEGGMLTQTEKLMSIPAQFRDIATGELISNDRCLHNCKELDRFQKLFQEARELYKAVKRDTQGSKEEKKAAAKKASEEHACWWWLYSDMEQAMC